jgi:hypothetical protein
LRKLLILALFMAIGAVGLVSGRPDPLAAQQGPVIRVTNAAQLSAAIADSASGTTIELTAGDYGTLVINNREAAGLTLVSADPASPARISSLRLTRSGGITLAHITLDGAAASDTQPFLIANARDITLTDLTITGPGPSRASKARGLMIRASERVRLEDSTISQFMHGVEMLDVTDLSILRNDLHDLRIDGIRGGGWTRVAIEHNLISDFRGEAADHPDGIQLWSDRVAYSSSGIAIRNNAILRGTGAPMQGVFVNEHSGTTPYSGMDIAGNIVLGGLSNAVMVVNADQVTITGNMALTEAVPFAAVRLQEVTATVTGNSVQRFNFFQPERVTETDNQLLGPVDNAGLQVWLDQWLAANPQSRAAQAGRSIVTPPL